MWVGGGGVETAHLKKKLGGVSRNLPPRRVDQFILVYPDSKVQKWYMVYDQWYQRWKYTSHIR